MGRKLISHPLWIIILGISLIISERGKAILDIKPSDTVVLVNSSIFFNCSTFNSSNSSKDIAWYHYSVGSDQRKDVYYDGDIYTNYKDRFRVEFDLSKGMANLIIQSATFEDAGRYECQDGKGFNGETANAQLNVLETVPTCKSNINPDGVIGPNDCRIPPDQVQMSCSIVYRGNRPVQLEWRNRLENDNSLPIFECSNTINHTTCNLTAVGDLIRNNSVYICQTKNTGKNTFSCSTNAIRILYAMNDNKTISKTDQDEFICSANSSQQCSYTWESDDGTFVFTSKTMKPTRSGQYSCKANCTLRGQTCRVIAGISFVTVETKTEVPNKTPVIAGVVISVLVVAVAAGVICYFLRRRLFKKCMKRKELEEDISLRSKGNKNGNDQEVIPAAESYDSVDSPGMVAMHEAFEKAPFLDKGLCGDIHGPVQFEAKRYVRERITCPEQKLFVNGRGLNWMQLDHDNLIKFIDVRLVKDFPIVYVIMEYPEGGSIRTALDGPLKEKPKELPFNTVKNWVEQIANGMNHLHENKIVHKGLQSAQILIMEPFDPTSSDQVTIKVASYNLSHDIKINPSAQVTFKGMFQWMPPEAFKDSDTELSEQSDIWSYGVTVWEILTKEIPHKGLSFRQIEKKISRKKLPLKIPASYPQVFRSIIKECFNRDPATRPSFIEILTSLRNM